jgi:hypothetical protein
MRLGITRRLASTWIGCLFTNVTVGSFNETGHACDYLSGEHFSVDSTPIQAWAGERRFVRKDGSDIRQFYSGRSASPHMSGKCCHPRSIKTRRKSPPARGRPHTRAIGQETSFDWLDAGRRVELTRQTDAPDTQFFEIEKLSNCTCEKLDRSAPIPDGRVAAIEVGVETTAPSIDAVTLPWLNLS